MLLCLQLILTEQIENFNNKAIQYLYEYLAQVYVYINIYKINLYEPSIEPSINHTKKGVMLSLGNGIKDCSSTGNTV